MSRFPKISHLDDLRRQVTEFDGIRIYERDDHVIANYVFAGKDTFRTAYDLECRGIVFERSTGDIIARPFHKFFNVGEREQLHEIDFSATHRVQVKLDGSMVFGLRVGGKIRFFTRGGPSFQANLAWDRAGDEEREFVASAVDQGLTPIFEWTAPDNRIVVNYPNNQLTLLAIRERESGGYLSRSEIEALAPSTVTLIEEVGDGGDSASWRDLAETYRALKGAEGVVIAFNDGHRLKLKADDYVTRHRAVGGLGEEKNVVKALLEDAFDDVLPLLADDVRSRLATWRTAFEAKVGAEARFIKCFCEAIADLDQKGKAAVIQRDLDRLRQRVAFQTVKTGDAAEALRALIGRNTTTRSRMDDVAIAFALPR